MTATLLYPSEALWRELWASLASLLRSYTAAHGLNRNRQAIIEALENEISVRLDARWLRFQRNDALVTWTREDGSSGEFEFTGQSRVRSRTGEEELDLAAESWARELMQDHTMELSR